MYDNNNHLLTCDADISNYLTTYYTSVGAQLSQHIPGPANEPLQLVPQNHRTFTLSPVTISEVKKLIHGLRNSVAPGSDKITAPMLKRHVNIFAPLLTKLINNSFNSGRFQRSLKVAVACVIHKGGDKRRAENQRFISVLSVVSKIWEGAVNTRLLNFLNDSNYFNKAQYGFISGSDTTAAAIDLVTFLQDALNSRKIASGTFIDVAKAFDSVNHELLIDKLTKAGINGPALNLLRDYLHNRPCSVKVNDTTSQQKFMKTGVPQGSILSSTLFLIFINDIFELNLHGKIQLYADDVSIIYKSDNTSSLNKVMNDDLLSIYEWFTANKLVMNVKKTNYMLFHHKQRRLDTNNIDINVAGNKVERVETFKYLGLHLDSQLNWHHHIDMVAKKIAGMVGAIHRARHHLHVKTRTSIYYSHVHSHLTYMSHIWAAADTSALRILEVLQNKAVRTIFWNDYQRPGVHTSDIYKLHKILPLSCLATFSAATTSYKLLHKISHGSTTFITNADIHHYNTRRKSAIHPSQPRNRWGAASITFRGATIFNNLPREIRHQPNLVKFKTSLKKYLLDEY